MQNSYPGNKHKLRMINTVDTVEALNEANTNGQITLVRKFNEIPSFIHHACCCATTKPANMNVFQVEVSSHVMKDLEFPGPMGVDPKLRGISRQEQTKPRLGSLRDPSFAHGGRALLHRGRYRRNLHSGFLV